MKKELRPVHDAVTCDVCGRTILKGERTDAYLAPGGHRHKVCDLCAVRAQHSGWIRESGAGAMPHRQPRSEPRRGLFGRMRRRRPEAAAETEMAEMEGEFGSAHGSEPLEYEEPQPPPPPPPPRPRSRPKDPRHVRAVPTTAEAKVERALELFNGSHHQRTIAGLARTLGPPLVSARPDPGQVSQVSIVVAWELSWYRYEADLADEAAGVRAIAQGTHLGELDEQDRTANAAADERGELQRG